MAFSRKAYVVYLVLSGASTLFNALMFTVMTVYYVTAVGLNSFQLVLVGTVLEVATFLFEVPTGVIADTYSRRLSVIIGVFVTGIGFLLVGAVPLFSMVLLGNIIWGIGDTFLSGALQAWIADEVGEAELGRVYLRATQIDQAALLIGTFASVALASIALQLPIVIGASLTIVLGVFLIFAMPEDGFHPAPRGMRTSWQTFRQTFLEGARTVRRSSILLIILGISWFFGGFSEGFDRLGQAHFLVNFTFPGLGALEPVIWFGIINAVGKF
jgi:DHA3 family tetracycline resistance protein-like MFS transporter